MPGIQIGSPLPYRSVSRGRPYSNVIFDPSTLLIVGASSLQAPFASFDDEGNRLWEPDGQPDKPCISGHRRSLILNYQAPNVSDPICDCSTLELISPDLWITMDG